MTEPWFQHPCRTPDPLRTGTQPQPQPKPCPWTCSNLFTLIYAFVKKGAVCIWRKCLIFYMSLLIKITQYHEVTAPFCLSMILYSLLSVFGTVGNVLSGIVMTRKSMKSNTMALMLTVLAVVDTLVLWVDLLRQYLNKIHDIDLRSFSNISCKLHR